ncbi:Pre-rrna-processing protein esf1 [Thalictrum thalictroides]|uniref:Pre-rrna-processing protein esf1 n=1 Tax=Thalictrum thalictroides TaxID=46969 RepID=A0A7J6VZJ2_THATH|nr:Pre-rrna-processing protein esf1 [Thalictrum thalictroides]
MGKKAAGNSSNKPTKKKKENTETEKSKKKNAKDNNNNNGREIITDPRFSSVHTDPRFQKHSKHQSKVTIDSRFLPMFTDKKFASSSALIDKRGKPKPKDSVNPLKHYYKMDDDEEEEELEMRKYKKEIESEDEEDEDEFHKKKNRKYKNQIENAELSSEDDEELKLSDESGSDTDDGEDLFYSDEEPEEPEEKIPEIDKETHRLAIVNMDWSQIKAVDLYVVMDSFLPKGGQILSVTVYPSEFGLKRMEEETVKGPIGLFDSDKEMSDDEDNDEIDNEKLRSYEKSRLRYYFAVVECDSIATADYIYKNCDGIEFEKTSNVLDLRFIPDTMQFEHPPRDVATEAPTKYEGVDFHTQALQQSKIRLTWDEDEPQRAKILKGKWNADELDKFREFLPSDDEESSDDDDNNGGTADGGSDKNRNKVDMYRTLIDAEDGSDENGSENDKDMEVTFNTGLEDISKRIVERNKDKKSETVWEATLRRQKEKKKARKYRSKDSSEEESSDNDYEAPEQPDDFFLEEPLLRKSKVGKSSRRKEQEENTAKEQEASRAELELLLADDQGADHNLKGYNLKTKKAKGKKGKEIPAEDKLPSVDYDDPRFSVLFKSPLFALDPTDAQYKRSAAYARQLVARQHKGLREEITDTEQEQAREALLPSDIAVSKNGEQSHVSSKMEDPEFSSLVRSLKRKTQQNRENEIAQTSKRVVPIRSNGLKPRLSPKPSKKKARHSKS